MFVPAVAQEAPADRPQPGRPARYRIQLHPLVLGTGQQVSHRDPGLRGAGDREQHAGGRPVVVGAVTAVTEHIDVHPVQPQQVPPQPGLLDAYPLDPIHRYRLAAQIGQPPGDPQRPAAGPGQGVVELRDHPAADQRDHTTDQRDQPGQCERPRTRVPGDDHRRDQAEHRDQELGGGDQAEHQHRRLQAYQHLVRAGQILQRPGLWLLAGRLDGGPLAVRAGQQIVAQLVRLGALQIAQGDPGIAAACLDPQLAEAEDPGPERLDHIDRLDPVERDPFGGTVQPTRLDPQLVAVDDEAGEPPAGEGDQAAEQHDAEHDRDDQQDRQGLRPLQCTAVSVAGQEFPADGDDDRQQDHPTADQRGQRMRAFGRLDRRGLLTGRDHDGIGGVLR